MKNNNNKKKIKHFFIKKSIFNKIVLRKKPFFFPSLSLFLNKIYLFFFKGGNWKRKNLFIENKKNSFFSFFYD
jgi:hypothetical protein